MVGSFSCRILHYKTSQRYVEVYRRVSADLSAPCAGQGRFATVASNVLQLAEGLSCLHNLGFIHCDLKPANVGYQCLSCSRAAASTDYVSGRPQGKPPKP